MEDWKRRWILRRRQLGWMRVIQPTRWDWIRVYLCVVPQCAATMLCVALAYALRQKLRCHGPASVLMRLAIACMPDDSSAGVVYGKRQGCLLDGESGVTQMMRVGLMIANYFGDRVTKTSDAHAVIVTNGLRDRLVSTMFALKHAARTRDERTGNVTMYWVNWGEDGYPVDAYLDTAKLAEDGLTVVQVDHPYDFKIPGHGSLKFALLGLEVLDLATRLDGRPDWSFFMTNPQEEDPVSDGDDFFHINLKPVVPYLTNVGPAACDAKFTTGELLTRNYGADLAVTHAAAERPEWRIVYDPKSEGPLRVDDGARAITQQRTDDLHADSLANLRCLVQFRTLYVGTASSFCDVVLAYNMALRRRDAAAPRLRIACCAD